MASSSSDLHLDPRWTPHPSGNWRTEIILPGEYKPGKVLIHTQIPGRSVDNNDVVQYRPTNSRLIPKTTVSGEEFQLSRVLFETQRGSSSEYVAGVQVWASTATVNRGGVVGLAFSFHEDALEVKVEEPDFQLKVMLVAGYGQYDAYPIAHVLGASLSDL
jgi:hypothetical protein